MGFGPLWCGVSVGAPVCLCAPAAAQGCSWEALWVRVCACVLGTDRLTFWGIRGYSGHGQHAVTRVLGTALRLPITALRLPMIALRVLGTALRQLIIALRVPITRGAGGGRRVRRRVGWLKDRGARRVDKRKPIPWITESQRCGFLLRAHSAGCVADGKERERLGGADNKALTDAGLGTVLSDSLRSLNLSNCSR